MNKRLKSFLYGISGVLVGISVVSIIKEGSLDELSYNGSILNIMLEVSNQGKNPSADHWEWWKQLRPYRTNGYYLDCFL